MPDPEKPQPSRRGRKVNVNFSVDPELVDHFRNATKVYVGRLSGCFAAAMAMWLAADPTEQGRWLKRVAEMEIDGEVQRLIDQLHAEQSLKLSGGDQTKVSKRRRAEN